MGAQADLSLRWAHMSEGKVLFVTCRLIPFTLILLIIHNKGQTVIKICFCKTEYNFNQTIYINQWTTKSLNQWRIFRA